MIQKLHKLNKTQADSSPNRTQNRPQEEEDEGRAHLYLQCRRWWLAKQEEIEEDVAEKRVRSEEWR